MAEKVVLSMDARLAVDVLAVLDDEVCAARTRMKGRGRRAGTPRTRGAIMPLAYTLESLSSTIWSARLATI